jgi:NAD(P)-dependent dehydrogenase (short-subunit alcohol dehydrogenase family)
MLLWREGGSYMTQLSRRQFLYGATTVAAASALPACSIEGDMEHPPGVPLGPFGRDSTAEEVTAGLDLTGKTAVVTGANSGLGYETMRVLAMRGAHVIGTGRTIEKAEAACASVAGKATPLPLELTDLDSCAACARAIDDLDLPIDMLILNAGIMALPELQQVNGIERHFFVNHVGHFAFANPLMQRVKQAEQGRVVVLSSLGHKFASENGIEFDNLAGAGDYDANRMYGQSKLANGLYSLELARRLQGTNATSNSLHPGIINTNLGRHMESWKKAFAGLLGWVFMKSVEAGAATQCYVAANPAVARLSGYYFADCNPVIPDPNMENTEMAARLWEVTEELTGVRVRI